MSVHTYYDLLRKADVTPDSGFPSAQAPIRSGAWIHPQAIVLAAPSTKPNLLRRPNETVNTETLNKPRIRCPDSLPAPKDRPASRYDCPIVLRENASLTAIYEPTH